MVHAHTEVATSFAMAFFHQHFWLCRVKPNRLKFAFPLLNFRLPSYAENPNWLQRRLATAANL